MADKNFVVKNGLESPVLYVGVSGVISWDSGESKLQFSNNGGSTVSDFGSGSGGGTEIRDNLIRFYMEVI